MKRLTSNNCHEMDMTHLALNQVYVGPDGWAWYVKAPEEECSVCDLIRDAAAALDVEIILGDEELSDLMTDWLQYGEEEPEGVLAILYRALWAMAELRNRLSRYEDTGLEPEKIMALISRPNDPLTLEELREMDGEPVWIEVCGSDSPEDRMWALVCRRRFLQNIGWRHSLFRIVWNRMARLPPQAGGGSRHCPVQDSGLGGTF